MMGVTIDGFVLLDDSQQRWEQIFATRKKEAKELASSLVAKGLEGANGCIVTGTSARRKVRFNGSQFPAYRFIYCALTETTASYDDVIRHRCHNPLCINPEHLTIGSRADNKHDDWEFWANGIDPAYL